MTLRVVSIIKNMLISVSVILCLLPLVVVGSIGDRSAAYHRCLTQCVTANDCFASSSSTSTSTSTSTSSQTWLKPLWSCTAECRYACMTHLTDLATLDFNKNDEPEYIAVQGHELEGLYRGKQVQFNGKWPFHRWPEDKHWSTLNVIEASPMFNQRQQRWFKMQEPLSVLFSMLNFVSHTWGLCRLMKMKREWSCQQQQTSLSHRHYRHPSPSHNSHHNVISLCNVYIVYSLTGLNTWIWSSVFHTRDVDWTERADYFSAAAGMICGLWVVIVRLAGLYTNDNQQQQERRRHQSKTKTRRSLRWSFVTCSTICVVLFVWHCHKLTKGGGRFDYTYNMQFNVTVAILTILLWSGWSVRHVVVLPRKLRRTTQGPNDSVMTAGRHVTLSAAPTPGLGLSSSSNDQVAGHALRPLLPLLLLPLLSCLELFDFEPVGFGTGQRLLDSHALWHLTTVPVVVVWYRFLCLDLRWIRKVVDDVDDGDNLVDTHRLD
ncbi:hypothetical protein OIO90_004098 [Microbotryomycetes sp. JL221]|nr:hypothetical protein OIO90_004098 [Microbotryomycetes sp. JL221]